MTLKHKIQNMFQGISNIVSNYPLFIYSPIPQTSLFSFQINNISPEYILLVLNSKEVQILYTLAISFSKVKIQSIFQFPMLPLIFLNQSYPQWQNPPLNHQNLPTLTLAYNQQDSKIFKEKVFAYIESIHYIILCCDNYELFK